MTSNRQDSFGEWEDFEHALEELDESEADPEEEEHDYPHPDKDYNEHRREDQEQEDREKEEERRKDESSSNKGSHREHSFDEIERGDDREDNGTHDGKEDS
jgi:hypothetical protein